MLTLFRNRSFLCLWLGGLVSTVGDWALITAAPFYIYKRTGSAAAAGGLFACLVVPNVLFGSVAGVVVDHFDRRKVMMIADLLRFALLFALCAADIERLLWLIYAVAFAESSLGQLFQPAKSSLVPQVVKSQEVVSANALDALADGLGRIIGAALGGALLATVTLKSVLALDALSYLASATLLSLMGNTPTHRPLTETTIGYAIKSYREGLAYVREHARVRSASVVMGLALIGWGIVNVVLVAFVGDVLGKGAAEFGWLAAARGVGGIVGVLLLTGVYRSLDNGTLMSGGAAGFAILIVAIVSTTNVAWISILIVILGIADVAIVIGFRSLLQSQVGDAHLGRTFGAFNTVQALMMLIGMGVASGLTGGVGPVALLFGASALYMTASAVGVIALRAAHVVGPDSREEQYPS